MGEGGAQRVLLSLLESYLKEAIEVTVITLAKNDLYKLPKRVKHIALRGEQKEASSLIETLLMPYYAWRLKKYIKRDEIERIQSHLFRANFVNILSRLFGARHEVQVVNHSVISRFFKGGVSAKINLFCIKHLYPKADKIFYISKRMQEDFVRYVKGVEAKSVMIHNPYDIKTILEESERIPTDFTFNSSKTYLITVGRLITLKRFKDVLLVLSQLEESLELIMLGDGEQKVALIALAKELKISSRVHLLGQIKNPYSYIKRSHLFISSSSVEGFPNVLVEAMVCGTAIISSDCISGPREILAPSSDHNYQLKEGVEQSEFGILYGVGDVASLSNSIKLLLKDERLRTLYEAKAFQQSQQFSLQKIANLYRENYFLTPL